MNYEQTDSFPAYYVYPDAFSESECLTIKLMAQSLGYEPAAIMRAGEPVFNDYRICDTASFTKDFRESWIAERVMAHALEANRAFRFQILSVSDLLVCRYEVGGRYKDHIDLGEGVTQYRKLSVVVQLDDPSDYEGGELVFSSAADAGVPSDIPKERGTIIVFPSFTRHRVEPVTKGTRHSLVSWVGGTRFQ